MRVTLPINKTIAYMHGAKSVVYCFLREDKELSLEFFDEIYT